MNKSEKGDTGHVKLTEEQKILNEIEVLSDCGDEFCECQDQSLRPCSRGCVSEEEFQDAETGIVSRGRPASRGLFQNSRAFSNCLECLAELSERGIEPEDSVIVCPEETASSNTNKHSFQTWRQSIGSKQDGESAQAPKRFKRSSSGKGDFRGPTSRVRSFTRIPVPAGKSLLQQAKTSGAKESHRKDEAKEQEQDGSIVQSNLPTMDNVDLPQECPKCQESESAKFEESEVSLENPCKESTSTQNDSEENETVKLEESQISSFEFQQLNDPSEMNHSFCENSDSAICNPQAEFVVMTLAEERYHNQYNNQKLEAVKNPEVAKPQPPTTPPSAKRRANSKDKARGDMSSSTRLSAMIRERSRVALMRPEDSVFVINQTRLPSGRSSRGNPGLQNSALGEPVNVSPRSRLQAIKHEKAQIRQRMTSNKPMSPMRSRRILGTPTVKHPVSSAVTIATLKRDIQSRRSAIERLSKDSDASKTSTGGAAVHKTGHGDAVPSVLHKEEGHQEITSSANKDGSFTQPKQRTKTSDRTNICRTPRTAVDTKAELCSLSVKYQARLKKYEAQKNDIARTQAEMGKTVSFLNQLRENIVSLSGEDPGEVEVPQIVLGRPFSAHAHAGISTDRVHVAESSTSITGTQISQLEDKSECILAQVEMEKGELLKRADVLKKENDTFKKVDKEREQREIGLKKEISKLSGDLKESEMKVKELEQKVADRDNTLKLLRGNMAKMQEIPEKLKQKENQITSLKRQFAEESKEHNQQLKKALDAKESLYQDLLKEREHFQEQFKRIQQENESIKAKYEEISNLATQREKNNSELHARLEREVKKNCDLEAELLTREKYVTNLERKLEDLGNSSTNILGLSEQLMQKDSIISELEKHRASVQCHNREMCSLLSNVFKILGQDLGEEEIENQLTSGRIKSLKNMLTQLVNEKIDCAIKTNECSKTCLKKVLQLEDQVAVLQAELQESKNYSETLAGMISETTPWGSLEETNDGTVLKQPAERECSRGDQPVGLIEKKPGSPCLIQTSVLGYTKPNNSYMNQDIRELFVLLEGKRQALLRMERKMQELEEIHSNCAQKRVRNEIRIDQLEMMLATYKDC